MTTDRAILRTARLTLRPLGPGDAAAVTDGIADWEVIRWLTTPPWPFGLADATAFIDGPASAGARAILRDARLIGVAQIHPSGELGYWLRRDQHGQGLMTEAAAALVADHLKSDHLNSGGVALWSGYVQGNTASCAVLTKLGFHKTGVVRKPSRPLGHAVDIVRMALLPDRPRAAHPAP